jgi:hypothetical protein
MKYNCFILEMEALNTSETVVPLFAQYHLVEHRGCQSERSRRLLEIDKT